MTRLVIICEGPTEQTFVSEVLGEHLGTHGVDCSPRLIGRPGQKGGDVTLDRIASDARDILRGDRDAYCTTLVDYYGFKAPALKAQTRRLLTLEARAAAVQQALSESVQRKCSLDAPPHRFIPYVQMHEFEALLFSDCDAFARGLGRESLAGALTAIVELFDGNPERINDKKRTAPSNRVLALVPGYDKVFGGNVAAIEVGLPAMRARCPLFNAWVNRLEALRAPA